MNLKNLNEAKLNEINYINKINAPFLLKERLLNLGFVKNEKIKVIREGKKKSLRVYLIRGFMIALRKEESAFILVGDCFE